MSGDMFVISTTCQNPVVYHTKRDCPRLSSAKSVRKRSRSYIEYHELELCKYCDDSVHVG